MINVCFMWKTHSKLCLTDYLFVLYSSTTQLVTINKVKEENLFLKSKVKFLEEKCKDVENERDFLRSSLTNGENCFKLLAILYLSTIIFIIIYFLANICLKTQYVSVKEKKNNCCGICLWKAGLK